MSTKAPQDSSTENLKVVHLSTSHSGGAGIAARRLNEALNLNGVNSVFIALASPGYEPSRYEKTKVRGLMNRLESYLFTNISKRTFKRTYFTLFSSSSVTLNYITSHGDPENTIIHVHNWFNLMNLRVVRKILKRGYRIVFTLHDQRIFTGGCHYSLDCDKFTKACANCPELPLFLNHIPRLNVYRTKRIFHKYHKQITCISPSGWLKTLAQKSKTLQDIPTLEIGNIHDLSLGGIATKNALPVDRVTFGIASFDRYSPLKGYNNFLALEAYLIEVDFPFDVIYLSDFGTDASQQSSFWKEIDYLLVLSNADNSPNVIHEAKIYGVPVIGTKIGGIPELLNSAYDLCVSIDADMPNRILEFLRRTPEREKLEISSKITADYKIKSNNLLGLYLTTYQKVISVSQ
jgi:glycosyltransferase involved in cell wall biosynthesis